MKIKNKLISLIFQSFLKMSQVIVTQERLICKITNQIFKLMRLIQLFKSKALKAKLKRKKSNNKT